MYESSGFTMGTRYNVKFLHLPKPETSENIFKNVAAIFESVNQSMSTYLDDSELSQLNKNTSTDWLVISDDLYRVIDKAIAISQLSEGAFDITVGPLVNLWGFGPKPEPDTLPTDSEINNLLNTIGYNSIELDPKANRIRKLNQFIYLDLSALAKGYAVDKAAQYLDSLGIENYMIEIGGDLITKGVNHINTPWRIAIEEPVAEQYNLHTLINLRDNAIATSGDYRNYYERDGKRFSHAINPKTGKPIEHALASVSVIHKKTMDADAWATALLVLGPDKGFELAEKEKLAVFFIVKTDHGFENKITSALQSQINQNRTNHDSDK